MLIVSSREFRDNQKAYLDKIDSGEEVILQRKGNKSYKILPVNENDTLMTKDELLAKVALSLEQIKEGKTTVLDNEEEIAQLLAAL